MPKSWGHNNEVNDDWAWDQFDLTSTQGEVDITNDEFLHSEEAGLTRTQQNQYETKFIDELYGTDDAVWAGETGMPYNNNAGGGILQSSGSYVTGDVVTMGLDLRRVLNEDLEVGTPEHYEWLTRGEVDWASYENDNAYQKAFNSMKNDKDAWRTYGKPSGIDFLTSDDYSDQQKVNFIRDAADFSASNNETDDKWHIPDDFDNKYEPKYYHTGENKGQPIDPESVQPYEASPLFDPNSEAIQSRLVGADGQRMTIRTDIAEASAAGSPRNIEATARRAGITIRPVNVKRPSNIPASWGSVTGGND